MRNTDSRVSVQVWDEVAKNYILDISDSDREIGEFLKKNLKQLGIQENGKVLELGCGSGHVSAILAEAGYDVGLLDFSKVALEKSIQIFEANNLEATCYCQDFFKLNLDTKYDVIWNSGVMEHFNRNEIIEILNNVKKYTKKYFIVLVPNPKSLPYLLFRYNEMSNDQWQYDYEYLRDNYEEIVQEAGMKVEHIAYVGNELTKYLFSVGNDGQKYKTYFEEMSENKLVPEEQLYLKAYIIDTNPNDGSGMLSKDSGEGIKIDKDRVEDETNRFDLLSRANGYRRRSNELKAEKEAVIRELEGLKKQLESYSIKLEKKDEVIGNKDKLIEEQEQKIFNIQDDIQAQRSEIETITKRLKEKSQELVQALTQLEYDAQVIQDKEGEISIVKEQLENISQQVVDLQEQVKSNRLLVNENSILKQELQAIYGSTLWSFAKRYYHFRDNTFPINAIFKSLKKARLKKLNTGMQTIQHVETTSENTKIDANIKNTKEDTSINSVVKEAERTNKYEIFIQDENYMKQDIIVLSVIDWDFRFQRPQHLAKGLANLGHRTFYFNANYHKQDIDIKEKMNNLYVVTLSNQFGERIYDINFNSYVEQMKQEMDRMLHGYNVRECTVIVEYPTWEPVARYLKEVFGFKVVFDYIDDYTGFEDTAHMGLVQSTKDLLKISDLTIATSTFLAEKANEYSNNIKIIRNGTEFEVFNKASNTKKSNKRPKVGYYGAIAEWFDISVVEHIAMNRPDIDVELIGNVSCDECNRLSKYKNVKFLGEKKYDELWKYLQEYDVCLIPFKSDIDLIKATNPVKFYEYLSAGKKIVATEIPELEPFRDKYVYLANDKERFLDYVDLCIKGEDQLASGEELIEFAKTQDWSSRCIDMEKYIKDIHPLVSIIIITFNNLEITKKCINSIVEKTSYPNYEVIIVDNDSKDETPSYLKELDEQYEQIKVILNGENSGFAGGNNIGIREAQGEYIILLNNDTLVTRGWINGLIKHLDKPGIGFIGPVTNSAGNESQINVEYSKPEDMGPFAMRYTTDHFNELYYDIKVLAMFCVAIKREVFNEIGFLDENYLVGMFEDDDYSMAIIRQGYKIACAEDVFIHHFGRASFSKIEDERYKQIFEHNKKYYEEKWNTLWVPHKYRQG